MFQVEPIGYFYTTHTELYQVPRQPSLQFSNSGYVQLNKQCQFEQALKGLEGFERIWLIFRFHHHTKWKPMVLPPRGSEKQGVFATRSPHRPNFLGLSCVNLTKIEGLKLYISHHDLIDETPIFDIKPYLNQVDSIQSKSQGWLEQDFPADIQKIHWSSLASDQLSYLLEMWGCDLQFNLESRLLQSPYPRPSNRVKKIDENSYQLAYQSWRIIYKIDNSEITVFYLMSGYDQDSLSGQKSSKWNDVPIHQAFMTKFSSPSRID